MSFVAQTCLCIGILDIVEAVVLKNLMLFRFPLMAGLNDDFIAKIFQMWNVGFAFLSQGIFHSLKRVPVERLEFTSGQLLNGNAMVMQW